MSEFLADVLAWMEALPPLWAYVAILIIAYGENIIPPIPGDMVVVFGGYLVGVGKLHFLLVVALSTIGGTLGFMTMYAVGHRIGDAVTDSERLRWIPKDGIRKAQRWLARWELGLVAANRFLSGLRSVISLTVGMAHAPALKTALFATLSALAWTGLIAYAGYEVGDNWERLVLFLRDYGRIIVGIIVAFAIVQAARWYLKRKGSRTRDDESGNFGR